MGYRFYYCVLMKYTKAVLLESLSFEQIDDIMVTVGDLGITLDEYLEVITGEPSSNTSDDYPCGHICANTPVAQSSQCVCTYRPALVSIG
jgi:hypothetical protein